MISVNGELLQLLQKLKINFYKMLAKRKKGDIILCNKVLNKKQKQGQDK